MSETGHSGWWWSGVGLVVISLGFSLAAGVLLYREPSWFMGGAVLWGLAQAFSVGRELRYES